MKFISIITITLLLSGCVSAPAQKTCIPKGKASLVCEKYTAAPAGKALIYIYRPSIFFQAGAWPDMWINSNEIGPLSNNSFYAITVSPGEYNVLAKQTSKWENWIVGDLNLKLKVEPDKVYYVRVMPQLEKLYSVGFITSVSGTGEISQILKESAEREMQKIQYKGSASY